MKKILFLLFTVLLFSQISKTQNQNAKNLPLRIQSNAGSNGWSPDGKLFVTYTRNDEKTKLWNLNDESVIWETSLNQKRGETLNTQTFVWSDSQKNLIVKDERGKIYLLNPSNGKIIWEKEVSSNNLKIIRFSPDEKQIVLVFANEKNEAEIEFWNVETGRQENSFKADVKFFDSFAFSEDGKILKFGDFKGKAVFISALDGKVIKNLSLKPCGNLQNTFSNNTDFSPKFNYLVARCRDKTVITNSTTGKVQIVLKMKADFEKTIGFSDNERVLVLDDLGGYKTFNFADNSVKDIVDFDLWFYVDLNYDGSLLMNNTDYRHRGYEIADVKTGKVVKLFEDHPGIIKSLAFSPDGKLFASGSTDCVLRVWDTQTKKLLLVLEGHTESINSVEFGADGKTITSKSEKETIIWNAKTGAKIREIKEENRFGDRNDNLSPDGKFVLREESEKPFRLVDTKTGETVKEFVYIDQLDNLVFTPNQNYFLAKPWWNGWQLWSVESGKPIREFDVGYSVYNRVAFHPDGKTFITGGEGQNIFMFNLETGEMLWSLFPIDHEEFEQKKAWEARRVGFLKWRENYAAQADIDNGERVKKITAKFSHYGTAESFWDQKIAESGVRNKSKLSLPKSKATVAWFMLTNDADLPVSIDTNSMIFNPKCKGLCDGAEISSRYVMELENGDTRVNGFDMYSKTILPPKTTVYFSVALEHFAASKAIYLGFMFQKDNPDDKDSDDYGSRQKLYLRESDLPK